ncbi:MAG: glycine cleavage system aminomethyltransferase GcvT [bacterium]|nr:glycine cleavage system aminomethyltransferase GcvT [bacterium]
MRQSPLHNAHVQFGAKLVDFAGWQMPLKYTGIIEEHNHTRTACSLFDVSHMGRIRVGGAGAETLLQWLCTRNLDGMTDAQCRYAHLCREDGGILDDVIVSRYAADDWLVVCNAGNREKVLAWLTRHAAERPATVTDETFKTAMIALQGPETRALMAALLPIDLTGLKRYGFLAGSAMGFDYSVFRSGYTGEDGYEAIIPAAAVQLALPAMLGTASDTREDLKPAGLGARDTLRLEAGMPLYGHELTENIDSLSAGQAWCVDLAKDFIGAETLRRLQEDGCKVALVGLEIEGRRIARQHTPVLNGDSDVGEVTSGTMSPTLGKNIAMASVSVEAAAVGTELAVDLGGKRAAAVVVPLPFYKRPPTK